MRDKAAARVRTGQWDVFAKFPEGDARAQYLESAKIIRQTFSSPAGRQTLDWMLSSFLLRTQEPMNAEQAMFHRGQASVVTQILHNMRLGDSDGD